jgi:hypothetical protein
MRAKTINESSFDSIVDSIEFSNVFTEEMLDDIKELYGHELMDSEENQYRLSSELEDKFSSLISDFDDLIENEQISIYRKISVDDKWIRNLKNDNRAIGIYWSWEQDAAEAHWGYAEGLKEITLESKVNIGSIDWLTTFQQNVNPSYDEEKEIRLNPGVPVKLIAVYDKEGNNIPLPPEIKNKTFKA